MSMLNSIPLVEVLVPILVAIFASSGLWSFLLYIAQRRDQKQDTRTKAILVLLHDAVYRNCERAIRRGYTTLMEFDNITELYNVYHSMGGNGTGTELYERVRKLPIRDEIGEATEKNDN